MKLISRLLMTAILSLTTLASGMAESVIPESSAQVKLTFAPVVKRAAPAVVNVYATRMVERRRSPFAGDPFFERFFGDRRFGTPRQRQQNSLGSGVIVDPSGIVVTNFHVIRDATDVKIAFSDRREFDAAIVLRDERTDLAILKVDTQGEAFPSLDFSSSEALEVGDLVLAIGNPFGVGQTVTQGIVSALARTRVGITDSNFFIQTDAAINPGNSGGALLNMNGDIVGINTAIYSRSGGSNGIGFAIPSDMVRTVVNSALRGAATVQRPWVGASFQNVTADIALGLGLERPRGVLVTDIYSGGPADRADIEVGDLIVAVNDTIFNDLNGFNYRLATLGIGAEADLSVVRGGKKYRTRVPLSPAPETTPRDERLLRGRSPFSGATVANLSPALLEELRLKGPDAGVVVTEIRRGSPAARVGLRKGDVILQISGDTIVSTERLEDMTSEPRRLWRFAINRRGKIIRSAIGG
ncbi:MAG: DegQ family serine endoprotease [Pseudomonadota bacterium]